MPPADVAAKSIMSRVSPTAALVRCVTESILRPSRARSSSMSRGTINLLSPLEIGTPNLTIAGQTAPGNGICVTGARTMLRGQNAYIANNTIVRYMRFRNGSDPINDADDSFSISAGNNIMIDHVSASWGSDENLSITGIANNVTVQWSLISEALNANNHGYGSLIAPELPGTRITLHHNLYADDAGRTPRAGTRNYVTDFVFDYRNNVNYNWGTRGDWGGWGVVGSSDNEETLTRISSTTIPSPVRIQRPRRPATRPSRRISRPRVFISQAI